MDTSEHPRPDSRKIPVDREEELLRTAIGSRVLCPDKDLLCEEAPDAYKNIDRVIQDLREFQLIDVVAAFRPLFNCKP